MTSISIPDDTYRRLAERAAALHTTADALAAAALAQVVETTAEPTAADRDRAFAGLTTLLDGLDLRRPPGQPLDDRREAAYPDAADEPAADAAERLRDFDALIAGFRARPPAYPPGHVVDVSRDAMYAGCGE